MAKTFNIKILTLGNIIMDDLAEKLFTTTAYGDVEILANHAPSIFSTIPSITTIIDGDGQQHELFTSKGVINVKNNVVTFCCDSAEDKSDIDLERAEKAKARAEKRINEPDKYDVNRAKEALLRAEVRIKLLNK